MSSSKEVVLVDAGSGNLHSVENALLSLGESVKRTDQPNDLLGAGRIILPGVGAFARFMQGLISNGLADALLLAIQRGTPVLGICVGMQVLFEMSTEMGEFAGLGVTRGKVIRFPDLPDLKVPHTCWNQVAPVDGNQKLFAGLRPGCYAYFNHSYFCQPDRAEEICAFTNYGLPFCSAITKDNVYGVQFHPEKSQRVGLRILENFLNV